MNVRFAEQLSGAYYDGVVFHHKKIILECWRDGDLSLAATERLLLMAEYYARQKTDRMAKAGRFVQKSREVEDECAHRRTLPPAEQDALLQIMAEEQERYCEQWEAEYRQYEELEAKISEGIGGGERKISVVEVHSVIMKRRKLSEETKTELDYPGNR